MSTLAGIFARFEHSARIVGVIKLASVGLTLLWGFAVTFVFVRVLPLDEFQAFLLLVAFGNVTISAEFGITNIAYNRLRRSWLSQAEATGDKPPVQDFRPDELGVLMLILLGLVLLGTLAVAVALGMGWLKTGRPVLFLTFFLTYGANLVTLMLKRITAAIDMNLAWETLDCLRRAILLLLLVAALLGVDILLSILLQLAASLIVIAVAMAMVQHRLRLRRRVWLGSRAGGGHVRRSYWLQARSSVALTLSEIAAYNAPYFTIAAATSDPRPMLLFDFVFKIARALSNVIRALSEAALPRITAAFYSGRGDRFRQILFRLLGLSSLGALAGGALLMLVGQAVFKVLFHGKGMISPFELALLAGLLIALSIMCVSIYVQNALGRFSILLPASLLFVTGSLASVPVALTLGDGAFSTAFLACYAGVFVLVALAHAMLLRRLAREVPA